VLFDRLKSADLARHPLLAGRELLDVACYLLLSDGDPVDGLPHRVENERYGVESRSMNRVGNLGDYGNRRVNCSRAAPARRSNLPAVFEPAVTRRAAPVPRTIPPMSHRSASVRPTSRSTLLRLPKQVSPKAAMARARSRPACLAIADAGEEW
jgi:hypothetical protein